jgi:hypothetical protein
VEFAVEAVLLSGFCEGPVTRGSHQYNTPVLVTLTIFSTAIAWRDHEKQPVWALMTRWIGGSILGETAVRLAGEYLCRSVGMDLLWIDRVYQKLFAWVGGDSHERKTSHTSP